MSIQVGSVVSLNASHLCGPQFEPGPEPCIWIGFFSPYLTERVFPIGGFLPCLKLKFVHCLLYKNVGVIFPLGCFGDYIVQIQVVAGLYASFL